jgi:hypothetical protein
MISDIIDPRFLTVQEWTDSMVFSLLDKSDLPRLDAPEAWKEWAMTVLQDARISQMNPPDPRFFDDWREWAFRFNQALS